MSDEKQQTYGVETAAAVRDLLALMGSFEERFRDGDPALPDEQSVLEGYRWIFTIVQAGMQAHLWADTQRPKFVDIVGRYMKWGGDNSDAFYQYAPIDPTKTYRVTARQRRRGLLLAHGLRRSERRPVLGAHRRLGQRPRHRRSAPTARSRSSSRRTSTRSRGSSSIPTPSAPSPATTSSSRTPAGAWSGRSSASTAPTNPCSPTRGWPRSSAPSAPGSRTRRRSPRWPSARPNVIEEPYPVPTTTFGWAAGDAAYAIGAYELADDQALVIRGRSPSARSGTCASGTRSCTPTTRTTTG